MLTAREWGTLQHSALNRMPLSNHSSQDSGGFMKRRLKDCKSQTWWMTQRTTTGVINRECDNMHKTSTSSKQKFSRENKWTQSPIHNQPTICNCALYATQGKPWVSSSGVPLCASATLQSGTVPTILYGWPKMDSTGDLYTFYFVLAFSMLLDFHLFVFYFNLLFWCFFVFLFLFWEGDIEK